MKYPSVTPGDILFCVTTPGIAGRRRKGETLRDDLLFVIPAGSKPVSPVFIYARDGNERKENRETTQSSLRCSTLPKIKPRKGTKFFGGCSFPSTMLIVQTGSKQAENGSFLGT